MGDYLFVNFFELLGTSIELGSPRVLGRQPNFKSQSFALGTPLCNFFYFLTVILCVYVKFCLKIAQNKQHKSLLGLGLSTETDREVQNFRNIWRTNT